MAGVDRLRIVHAGMASIWEEGGTMGIHFPCRERETALSRSN